MQNESLPYFQNGRWPRVEFDNNNTNNCIPNLYTITLQTKYCTPGRNMGQCVFSQSFLWRLALILIFCIKSLAIFTWSSIFPSKRF